MFKESTELSLTRKQREKFLARDHFSVNVPGIAVSQAKSSNSVKNAIFFLGELMTEFVINSHDVLSLPHFFDTPLSIGGQNVI